MRRQRGLNGNNGIYTVVSYHIGMCFVPEYSLKAHTFTVEYIFNEMFESGHIHSTIIKECID